MSDMELGTVATGKGSRQLAYDTRALPVAALTAEEKDIIGNINGLLRQLSEEVTQRNEQGSSGSDDPWAKPESDRRNNIIMIDGVRGAGKTSLLLTLLAGWQNPDQYGGKNSGLFEGMPEVVRALPPIDFDPLPPDLSLFNWIIQAFAPLVGTVSEQGNPGLTEPKESARTYDTLAGQYLNLQSTAAVGWTSGLLKQSLGNDIGEFLLWQSEQQGNWQELQGNWQQFLDKLILELEGLNENIALPKGGVIVLPIDDLDLQVQRTRELLLTLRVLRHRRIVYLVTGDIKGTDFALSANFYREFIHNIPTISSEFRDRIIEITDNLGPRLREKTIPSSHLFRLDGQSLKGALDWQPHTDGISLGRLLDNLWEHWQHTTDAPNECISKILGECASHEGVTDLPFRELQTFYDRWINDCQDQSDGIVDFLKLTLESPSEEALTVSRPSGDGGIEITGDPGIYAPAPKLSEQIAGPPEYTDRVTIKWAKQWEFVAKPSVASGTDSDHPNRNSSKTASPGQLLVLDLAAWDPSRFQIVGSGLSFTDPPLGLVWTEVRTDHGYVVISWPSGDIGKDPSSWISNCRKWNQHLISYSSIPHEETMIKAWCTFLAGSRPTPNDSIEKHLEVLKNKDQRTLNGLANPYLGLSEKIRKIVADLSGPQYDHATKSTNYEGLRNAVFLQTESPSLDPTTLAFIHHLGDGSDTSTIEMELLTVFDA